MFSYPTLRNQTGWSPLTELRRELNRLTEDLSEGSGKSQWQPACDVEESQDRFLITLEVAGVPKDQIKIEVEGNRLLVSGERSSSQKKKSGDSWYSERTFGSFQRSFALPSGVDGNRIGAHYQDGLLQITVPKAESIKPRQVPIGNGETLTTSGAKH